MSDDDHVIQKGPFKGKRITFASTERIAGFAQISGEFMEEICDLMPGEYLISDESDLRDFTHMGSSDTSALWARITSYYGIEEIEVGSGRFVDIFSVIARRREAQ